MAMARETGDRLMGALLLIVGLPAMTAGIVVGVRLDDIGLVIGSALNIVAMPYVFRDTLLATLERMKMFRRNKQRSVVLLSVVAVTDSNRVGVLEVERGNFRPGDTLRITEVYTLRGSKTEAMKVHVLRDNHVHSAGTLLVRNGNFEPARRLVVETVEKMPVP